MSVICRNMFVENESQQHEKIGFNLLGLQSGQYDTFQAQQHKGNFKQ